MTETILFWRCEHHPIATQNFFERRWFCEYEACHVTPLRWWDFGFHRPLCRTSKR